MHINVGLRTLVPDSAEAFGLALIPPRPPARPPHTRAEEPLPSKREFKLPWREAGPPNHLDDKVDSDQ